MHLAGIQKTTLMDYPGKVACILFTQSCNFACPYCHNPALIPRKNDQEIPEGEVFSFLEKRRKLLNGVVVTGGEPTLQEDLEGFITRIKDMGFAVKLDTNGSRPGTIKRLLGKNLLDYVAMDIKTLPSMYKKLLKAPCAEGDIRESIRLIMESGLPYEFRTTCAPDLINRASVEKLGQMLAGAKLWVFQRCGGERTLVPDFLSKARERVAETDLTSFAETASRFVRKCSVRGMGA